MANLSYKGVSQCNQIGNGQADVQSALLSGNVDLNVRLG